MDLCYGSYNGKQHSRQSRDDVPTVAHATVQNEQTIRFWSYFSLREDPRCLLSRVHILPCASLWSFSTGLLLRTWLNEMHFLLLWQHWLVCLIPSFRTETAHSLLLPIQQSGSMVSPEETDVVMFLDAARKAVFLDGGQKARLDGVWFGGFGVVWNCRFVCIVIIERVNLIKPGKNVRVMLHPKFRGKKYKTVL